jgi:hypothetical protein
MKTVIATLQYIALDLTSRAIPQYAKYFEFNREEYVNMVDGLVGNYCSSNISVISKKELRNNLIKKILLNYPPLLTILYFQKVCKR